MVPPWVVLPCSSGGVSLEDEPVEEFVVGAADLSEEEADDDDDDDDDEQYVSEHFDLLNIESDAKLKKFTAKLLEGGG